MDESASIISSFQAPHGQGYSNRGIDWDGECLFLMQNGASGGYIFRLTTGGSVVNSYQIPSGSPAGVAWDGKCVWFSDKDTDWVYRMSWTDVGVEPASLGRVRAIFR
jgi:sugar lactone lactonase YvrE